MTNQLILLGDESVTTTVFRYKFPKKDSLVLVETETCENGSCTSEYRLEFNKNHVFPQTNKYILHKEKVWSNLLPVLSIGGSFREYLKSSDYVNSNNASFEFYVTKVTTTEESIDSKTSIVKECPLERLQDQSIFDDCELFFLSYYNFMIYDEQGLPVSRALYCNYIDSVFNNSHLVTLKKVISHIKNHPWVVNPDDLEIQDVPYYNNEDGSRKYIENLYLCPSDQEWVELVELEAKKKSAYGARAKDYVYHRMWKEYDPLGITQFIRPKYEED